MNAKQTRAGGLQCGDNPVHVCFAFFYSESASAVIFFLPQDAASAKNRSPELLSISSAINNVWFAPFDFFKHNPALVCCNPKPPD